MDDRQIPFFDIQEYEDTATVGDSAPDTTGEDDPDYIAPKIEIHHGLARFDYEKKAIANFAEMIKHLMNLETCDNPQDFSGEVVAMWMKGCQMSAEIQSMSREGLWDEHSFREVQNEVLEIIGGTLMEGIGFDNTPAPVIEEVTEPEKPDGLNRYKCKGSTNHYWRYSYRVNGRLKHLHIKGGNERAPLVKKRVATIQKMIASGATHETIVHQIKSY